MFAAELTPGLPPASATGPKRRLHIGNHILEFSLLRSKRRTIGFLIDDDGLRVTAPRWVPVGEIEAAVREKQRWIFAKLAERRERSARRLQPAMQWRDGAAIPYLGESLTLQLAADANTAVRHDEATRTLVVSLPSGAGEQQLKDRVQGWLQARARELFGERLPLYAERLAVSYRSFALSSATTQWGSCTADGR
ncbi:MAG: M48 family metallopeptidase, partial [Pseudomonadota bacterium]|nr:M48 family metallopeptidase [Pseudomonadota bacterium]